jgi:hypothetical protein
MDENDEDVYIPASHQNLKKHRNSGPICNSPPTRPPRRAVESHSTFRVAAAQNGSQPRLARCSTTRGLARRLKID